MMVRLARFLMLPLTGAALLGACTEDPKEDSSAGTTDDSASTGDEPTSAGEPTTAGETDAPTTTTPTGGEGTDSGSDSDSDSDGTTGEPSPWDGEPLPPASAGVWTWVDFPEAKCRDGSSTGIGVRYGSGDGLAIYFEGGGACFNTLTCGANPSKYDAGNFNTFASNAGNSGIYSRTNANNPLADWTFIYVPYCTGDVHAGARPDGTVPGVGGTHQFVGYLNVGHFLERIVPTFLADVEHVLVTGQSAGGFGAAFNYDRIADAFPDKLVTLLDDSGPPMSDTFLASCLQQQWRTAWNLDDTLPADCDDCFPADGGGIVNLAPYLANKHAGQRFGLISSLGDSTIRFFFGFGNDDCKALLPSTSTQRFTMGLGDLRDNWLDQPEDAWGTFYLSGEQHTWLTGSSFETASSGGGAKLIDWVRDLLDGQSAHVKP